MKKVYCRPGGKIEYFTSNDYVSACGDNGTNYLFKCDAGVESYLWYGVQNNRFGIPIEGWHNDTHPYVVYTNDGTRVDVHGRKVTFGKCGETHKASTTDDFILGYIDNYHTPEKENIPVYIWTDGGTNVHCTTDLDKEHWQTDRS